MSTAMFYAPILLIEIFTVTQLFRFWRAIQQFGHFDPVIRKYYPAFMADCMVLFLFTVQLALALHQWLSLSLDMLEIVTTSPAFVGWVVFGAFFLLVWTHCRRRLEHDSAIQTIVALNALDDSTLRTQL